MTKLNKYKKGEPVFIKSNPTLVLIACRFLQCLPFYRANDNRINKALVGGYKIQAEYYEN